MGGAFFLLVAGVGMGGGAEVIVTPPGAPGLEYTAPENRLHYTAPENRLHYTAED